MGKKSKQKRKDKSAEEIVDEAIGVRENVLSYTDYNTIMSIQLLIDRLNSIITNQNDTMRMVSALREEVDTISAYLMVPGDMKDGNKGIPSAEKDFGVGEEETERGTGEDPTPG